MRGSTGTQPFVGQRGHSESPSSSGEPRIAGRMDSYDFNTGLNAVYDPERCMDVACAASDAAERPLLIYINGKILVFGGEATGKVFGTNQAYDPKTDTWSDSRRWQFRATVCTAPLVR